MKSFAVVPVAVASPLIPPTETTHVAVIGNGPSALTLSYLLNGNWPYYNGHHPDDIIHARLDFDKTKSILEADFFELCSGITGQSRNVVSNLFDQLLHPSTIYGDADLHSCVTWRSGPHKVPHVILGRNPPGGAWQQMHGSKKALSFNSWLELPGLPLEDWMARRGCCTGRLSETSRLPLAMWKAYYNEYPQLVGLEENLRTGYSVTSVRNLVTESDEETGEKSIVDDAGDVEYPWEIKGDRYGPDGEPEPFLIRAKKVVLATGSAENPKKLHVAGEDKRWTGHIYDELHDFVTENLDLEEHPATAKVTKRCWSRILVVGSGLTAADAIITALTAGCHVFHIFDPKHSILSQLSERLYPEYAAIWKLMSGERSNSTFCGHYTPFPNGRVEKITNDHVVCVESAQSKKIQLHSIGFMAILVGSSPNLGYLQHEIIRQLPVKAGLPVDAKRNPVAIEQLSHESIHQPGLYVLGPLCGDNYVRFIPGGAVAAARSLIFDEN